MAAQQVQLLLLLRTIKQHKRSRQEMLRSYVLSLDSLPPELLTQPDSLEALKKYVTINDNFAAFCETHSSEFIDDLAPGHMHRDIHCISFLRDDDFSSVIGLPLRHFGNLFKSLRPALARAFPRCPEILHKDEYSINCSRRFKLFLTLYRLKSGPSHHLMAKLFGWCFSSIKEWHSKVLYLLKQKITCTYHNLKKSPF
jgi:hypothetical protein